MKVHTDAIKNKPKRGGVRLGQGRPAAFKMTGEMKTQAVTLRLYPTQFKEMKKKYGSIQKAIDYLYQLDKNQE